MDDRQLPDAEDRQLVDAARRGDAAAFETIVTRELGPVFAISQRILRDREDAADATQETFIAAYRALRTYRGEGTLRAWLGRIASRRAFAIRSARSRTAHGPVPPDLVAADAAADPESVATRREQRDRLLDLVAELPETYREVITLFYLMDIRLEDIAALTGRPLGTVKTHLHRGLEQLRDALGTGRRS